LFNFCFSVSVAGDLYDMAQDRHNPVQLKICKFICSFLRARSLLWFKNTDSFWNGRTVISYTSIDLVMSQWVTSHEGLTLLEGGHNVEGKIQHN